MKKVLLPLFAITILFAFSAVGQSATIYSSLGSWAAANPGSVVENFEDTTLQPGLSFTSDYPGSINTGLGIFEDRVGPGTTLVTTWSHSGGFSAFGGWFDLANPGGSGTGIAVYADSTFVGNISNTATGQFWGFDLGGTLFSNVELRGGPQSGAWETYEIVDLHYVPVPEPSTVVLLGLGLIGVAGLARKRMKK